MGENAASHPSPPEGVVATSTLAEQKTNEIQQGYRNVERWDCVL
jgi:hypothetical protein